MWGQVVRLRHLLPLILLASAGTASAADRHRFDLPAGRLGDAVVALGRQAGISIGLSDPRLAGERVDRVSGRLSVEQALARLLRGRPARYVRVGPSAIRIVRAASRRPVTFPNPPSRPPLPDPSPPVELAQNIFVTAARRPVLLSDFPASLDLVDGDDPALSEGLTGDAGLVARIPSLSSTHLGPGRNKLFIRGMADSSFNGPTQSTTGRYLGDTRINYISPDPDLRLVDVDRVEVLRGPQGTLYGAGSLGGIVRILPNRPRLDTFETSLSLGASVTEHGDPGADGSGMINLPLVADRVALRLVAYGASEGGYIDDPGRGLHDLNRVDLAGGRASLRFDSDTGWTVDIGTAVQAIRGRDSQFADDPWARTQAVPGLTRFSHTAQPFESDYLLADINVTRDWGDVRMVSSFGLVRHRSEERFDASTDEIPDQIYDEDTRATMISAEMRLSGESDSGLSWLVGSSLLGNETEQHRQAGPIDSPFPLAGVRNQAREAALFGDFSFALTDRIALSAGARLSYAHLSGGSLGAIVPVLRPLGTSGRRDEFAFMPSLALSWEAKADLLLFARFQEGFRPGGLGVTGDTIQAFENDKVSTVEAGLRHRSADGRIAVQASFAYTRWTDIQADTISLGGFPITTNIGDGRIWTADFSIAWRPLPGLSASLAGVFNDSEVIDPLPGIGLVSGFRLPNVADLGGRASVEYWTRLGPDLDLRIDGSVRYTGESRLGAGPVLGRRQGELVEVNLGGRLERGVHALTLSITNLTDQVGNRFAMGSPFTLTTRPQITPLRPRSLRVGWEWRF